ncbi:hypothetical protein F3J14_04170 [Burkholderia sp. Tr-862]|uniref:hypothetical protein n=1 Tax=Burkholderia sp. Tr-862 TaxID=2608331 RepID=UPI001419B9FA|nr:hypothetical protein [Burkholderia sp. Tr-862]NIF40108.1 hypothetical protein [Burkholderia sp. Tr-862]
MDSPNEVLPFDQGGEAYCARVDFSANPFPPGTWQHGEWYDGWQNASECDPDESYDWGALRFTDAGLLAAGLYSMTSQILRAFPSYFVKVEPHESDDPEGSDNLWLSVVDSDLIEGDLIAVRPASQNRWYVDHDLANKYGGWPTVWDFGGAESDVLAKLQEYLISPDRMRRS